MKILSRLLNNCRKPDRQIGMELGISGGAVGSRISKMEKLGIIEKFCLKVEALPQLLLVSPDVAILIKTPCIKGLGKFDANIRTLRVKNLSCLKFAGLFRHI